MTLLSRRSRRKPRHRGTPWLDGTTYLTGYLIALVGIEPRLVVGPLGAAGAPSQLVALGALMWWVYHQVQRPAPSRHGSQPVRVALAVVLLAFCVSYVVAMHRAIGPTESSTANLGILGLLGWLGVALLVNDGVQSRERFDLFTGRLVLAATALGLLGVAQFLTSDTLVRYIELPGLTANAPSMLADRSGFPRPAGTAMHPIEFGAVLTTILPLAIARARVRDRHVGALWAWLPVVAIALGAVLSNSRSAILCALVGLAVLTVAWPAAHRLVAAIAVLLMLAFVAVTIPGMLGNLTALFLGFQGDGSIQSRTGSYTIVGEYFAKAPAFGRGYSTFLPSYRILDNQYLLLLVEVGAVGLLAFLGLLVVAARCAVQARKHSTDRAVQEIGQAIAAGITAAGVGLATYDGLSFPMGTGVLFVMIGLAGCLRRLVLDTEPARGTVPGRELGAGRRTLATAR